MADHSRIEWTETTWNPWTGCTKVSPGCKNCYAERMSRRLQAMGVKKYRNGFKVTTHMDEFETPLRWKRPRMVFVCSMSDFLHPMINDRHVLRVLDVMKQARGHTFQVLTKRPQRMVDILKGYNRMLTRNVWFGVTVENQECAEEKVPILMNVAAKVRFVSCEPMLGPLDLRRWMPHAYCLKWVIVGAESGPGARPMKLEWARDLLDQCKKAEVPFFMKQIVENGKKVPFEDFPEDLKIREMPRTT